MIRQDVLEFIILNSTYVSLTGFCYWRFVFAIIHSDHCYGTCHNKPIYAHATTTGTDMVHVQASNG